MASTPTSESDSPALTDDQKLAVDAVFDNRCVFITGPAGTGKSVLIRYLVASVFNTTRVHLCSSTGISAYNIKGMTVHSFIARLQIKGGPMALNLSPSDVIIIDEISMLGKKTFEDLSDAIQRYYKTSGNPFGGHRMVFVGDFAQLPPVDDSFCFQSKYWSYVDKQVELKEIKRQTNREFTEFLLRIRSGELSIQDRRRLVSLSRKPTPLNTVHLYPTNDRARQYNETQLRLTAEATGDQIYSFPATVSHHGTNPEDESAFFQSQKARIYERLELCVGSRVMLTSNLNVEEGWMNGAICTVIEVYPENKEQLTIQPEGIRLEREGKTCFLMKQIYARQKYTRCNKCISAECSHPRSTFYLDIVPEEVEKTHPFMLVGQYPLLLAWGLTIHKSQGLTLPGCVIHLYGRYTPSLFYVAISRCVSEEGVVIRAGEGIRFEQILPEEMVMKKVFHRRERECKACGEVYVGPYTVCQDCCSCPAPYEDLPFTAFAKSLTKEKEDFVMQTLEYPEKGNKKFRQYLEKLYKVK